jgi:glutamine synthetase
MKQQLEPGEPHSGDAFQESITVARSLEAALSLLEGAEDLQRAMGHRFVKAYCAVKREEFEAFNKVISSWEREYLLLNV